MSNRLVDRRLRHAVVQLQGMAPDDFDGILDGLAADQRKRVLSLLEQLQGDQPTIAPESALAEANQIRLSPGISSWLALRVNEQEAAGPPSDHFKMTDQARRTLRLCAARLIPQPQMKSRGLSLMSRIAQFCTTSRA